MGCQLGGLRVNSAKVDAARSTSCPWEEKETAATTISICDSTETTIESRRVVKATGAPKKDLEPSRSRGRGGKSWVRPSHIFTRMIIRKTGLKKEEEAVRQEAVLHYSNKWK